MQTLVCKFAVIAGDTSFTASETAEHRRAEKSSTTHIIIEA